MKPRPNVWTQQGTVYTPNIELKRGMQKVATYCMRIDWSIFISSGNDGDHQMNSRHYIDDAVDILKAGNKLTKTILRTILGRDFDVVEYSWGFHIEYDPK